MIPLRSVAHREDDSSYEEKIRSTNFAFEKRKPYSIKVSCEIERREGRGERRGERKEKKRKRRELGKEGTTRGDS